MQRASIVRPAIMALTLLVALLFLGMRSLPAGSVLCIELGGHVALEGHAQACCHGVGDGEGLTDGAHLAEPSTSSLMPCERCLDLHLPDAHFDLVQPATILAPGAAAASPLLAVIDWSAARVASRRICTGTHTRSPLLLHIATIVIRC